MYQVSVVLALFLLWNKTVRIDRFLVNFFDIFFFQIAKVVRLTKLHVSPGGFVLIFLRSGVARGSKWTLLEK